MIELPERMRLTAESKEAEDREWLAALPARLELVCRMTAAPTWPPPLA